MTKPPRGPRPFRLIGPLTKAQLKIVKSPREELRRVTLGEKLSLPGRFSLKGEYFVPKTIKKVTARTAFTTVTRVKDFEAKVSHGKAAAERKAGARKYESAATEAQAETASRSLRETFRLKRKVKEIKTDEKVSRPKRFRKGPRRGEIRWVEERITDNAKDDYFKFKRKKLAGRWIEPGDWHEMMSVARAINDPMLSALMKS